MDSNDDNDFYGYETKGICQRLETKEASDGTSKRIRGETRSGINRQPGSRKRKTPQISTNCPFLHRRRTKRLQSQSSDLQATPKKKPAIFVTTMSPNNTREQTPGEEGNRANSCKDSPGDKGTLAKKKQCGKPTPTRRTPKQKATPKKKTSKLMGDPKENMEKFRTDFKIQFSGDKAVEIVEVHDETEMVSEPS